MNTKQELQSALKSALKDAIEDAIEEDIYTDPYCECGERLHYDPDNDWEISNCNYCYPP